MLLSPMRRVGFIALAFVVCLSLLEFSCWCVELLAPPAPQQSLPPPDPMRSTAQLDANLIHRQAQEPIRVELTPDPQLGWMPAPSAFKDEHDLVGRHDLGLRSPDPLPPLPEEVRLFSLGDSSIWGTGVNLRQTFTFVAAQAIGQAWHRPASGIVGGVPGYNSTQSYNLLDKVGPMVAPTWVVVANMWSDLGRRQLLDTVPPSSLSIAFKHFATYREATRLFAPFLRQRKIRFLTNRKDIGTTGHTMNSQYNYIADLHGMADWAKQHNARVVFVELPAPIDWDGAGVPETVASFRDCMAMVAAETGALLVDGPAYFKAHGADTSYFLDQVHPDDRGHYLLGQALAETIVRTGAP